MEETIIERLQRNGKCLIPFPQKNDGECAVIPLELKISEKRITLRIGDRKIPLSEGVLSAFGENTNWK